MSELCVYSELLALEPVGRLFFDLSSPLPLRCNESLQCTLIAERITKFCWTTTNGGQIARSPDFGLQVVCKLKNPSLHLFVSLETVHLIIPNYLCRRIRLC